MACCQNAFHQWQRSNARGRGRAGRGVSRGGYKHPQVLHKCALLSPSPRAPSSPLWPHHTTNSADALRLRNLRAAAAAAVGDAPLGCSNESSSTSSSGNGSSSSNDSNSCYLLVARLAWLDSVGVALLLLALHTSRTRFSRVCARALHKRRKFCSPREKSQCCSPYFFFGCLFLNVQMRKPRCLLSVLLAIVSGS